MRIPIVPFDSDQHWTPVKLWPYGEGHARFGRVAILLHSESYSCWRGKRRRKYRSSHVQPRRTFGTFRTHGRCVTSVTNGSIESATRELLAKTTGTLSNVGTTFCGSVNLVPLPLSWQALRVQGMKVTINFYLRDREGFKLVHSFFYKNVQLSYVISRIG